MTGDRELDPLEELEALCRACGLCCDGSLFGRVPLAPDEVQGARKSRLRVLPAGAAFEQPCIALEKSGDCACYAERPRACRAFSCRLRERHRREGGPLEVRLAAVLRVRELLAIARPGRPNDELAQRLEDDFQRA